MFLTTFQYIITPASTPNIIFLEFIGRLQSGECREWSIHCVHVNEIAMCTQLHHSHVPFLCASLVFLVPVQQHAETVCHGRHCICRCDRLCTCDIKVGVTASDKSNSLGIVRMGQWIVQQGVTIAACLRHSHVE